ncbi:ShlB/FhaC/HecB family hemolysin secretion/activation protein [Chitinimonas sp. BJYL2]|uniref:ShlB/FhaC/HecB family hemolysin secretion/activation protein n=1 Tax=Chitinimonas sp. BJYL2 TaxID=2976696 RepID=UPI0022B3754E|nr:ShlB/FhaC/HecB family hemolysin secretion/activation protein [Chitinimonas sp. BJYL2]
MKTQLATLCLVCACVAQATETLKFPVKAYRVEGNSLLPDAQIQAALAPFIGPERDFADVQRALEALEGEYRAAGYGVLQVYLPEQELNQGTVLFKVIEPRLGQVRIEGSQHYSDHNIRRTLPVLKEGAVPNTADLTQSLRLANEHPARRLAVTLQAGQANDSVDATIKVSEEKPWRAFVGVDNTGTSETGRTRLMVGYQHANLLDLDHVLTAQITTSPEKADQVQILGLGYRIPLYALGDSLSLYAGYSSVESGALQGLFTVNGKGLVAGARYNQALRDIGAYQHKLSWGLDLRRFDSATTFSGGAALPESRYTLRPISVGYQGQRQRNDFSYDINASLAYNLISSDNLAINAGRLGAKEHYSVVRYGTNLYYTPAPEWTLHAGLSGQFSRDALAPGEQFGLGGASSVRGYGERVVADDEGVLVNLEAFSPDWGSKMGLAGLSLRGAAFLDWGRLSRNQPLPGEATSTELAGAGLGLRLNWQKTAAIKLDVARALKEGAAEQKGDTRVHVSAVLSY